MLEIIKNTQQLLIVRERSWHHTRKAWVVLAVPISMVPFFYGLSYANEFNWLALFFLINGAIQLFICGKYDTLFFCNGALYLFLI